MTSKLACAMGLAFAAAPAPAQDATWLGGVDDTWTDTTLWDLGVVPNGQQYNWIMPNSLRIDEVNSFITIGGLEVGVDQFLAIRQYAYLTVDGGQSGGSVLLEGGLYAEAFGTVNISNVTFAEPTFFESFLWTNGGTMRIGENVDFGTYQPRISVNYGALEFLAPIDLDPFALELDTKVWGPGTIRFDMPNAGDAIDLGRNPFSGSTGTVELASGSFTLNNYNTRTIIGPNATATNLATVPGDTFIDFDNEVVMQGGTIVVGPTTSFITRLVNNGNVHGSGLIDVTYDRAVLNSSGTITADDPNAPLIIRGAGELSLIRQTDLLNLGARNGGTLKIEDFVGGSSSSDQLPFGDIIADNGRVELIGSRNADVGNLEVKNAGRVSVEQNSQIVAQLNIQNSGVVDVSSDSSLTTSYGGFLDRIDAGGKLNVDGQFVIDNVVANDGIIDLQPTTNPGGKIRFLNDARLTGTGVVELGDRTDAVILHEPGYSGRFYNENWHTIRGSGEVQISQTDGVEFINYGTVEAAGDNPLVFRGDPVEDIFTRNFSNRGLVKVAPGGTLRLDHANLIDDYGTYGDVELNGRMEVHNGRVFGDTITMRDGSEFIVTGTEQYTGSIWFQQWTTTGNAKVIMDGPTNDMGSPDEPNLGLRPGSSIGSGGEFDIRTGVLGIYGSTYTDPNIVRNDGIIRIGTNAKLALAGHTEVAGQGSITFDHGSTQAIFAGSSIARLVTSNTIAGRADLSNLELLLSGEIRSNQGYAEDSMRLKQLGLTSTAKMYLPLFKTSDHPDFLVERGSSRWGEIAGTLQAMPSQTGYELGKRYALLAIEDTSGFYMPFSGGFDRLTVGKSDPGYATAQISDDLQLLIDYQPDAIDVVIVRLGDANADNAINQIDLDLVLASFGSSANAAGLGSGELTGDGSIDVQDLRVVLANWTSTAAPVLEIPEPSAALLLLSGLSLTIRRRS